MDIEEESARLLLERLVVDNPDLERLEAIVDSFNPFVAMRWTRQETRHSTFLAWLLNPRETHGLGGYCLQTFLKRVARYSKDSSGAPSAIDVNSWNLEAASVSTEWQGIDVFVQDDVNQVVAVFENKVDSDEHSDQLRRYRAIVDAQFPTHRKLFSYLTIEGEASTDEGYIPISYEEIVLFIDDTLRRRGDQVTADVRSFMAHYAEMVRRHIVEDSEIQRLCKAIYAKHQKALDLIFEHKPNPIADVAAALQQWIQDRPDLVLDHCTNSYVRFCPASWDELPRAGEGWTPTGRMLLFEVELSKGNVLLKLVLGPGDQAIRDTLQSKLVTNPGVFNKAGTRRYPKWWSAHSEKWVTEKQRADSTPAEIMTLIRPHWERFLQTQLPAMERTIVEPLTP